jgi:ribosomal protein S18 acetylase RimI-like enzyme
MKGLSCAMNIHFQTNDSAVDWVEVSNLFTSIGWGSRDPHDVRAAFKKSTFACFAFDDRKLVGFGRTIDDGKYYATVVDVVVHPEYQHQNVGRQIMQQL